MRCPRSRTGCSRKCARRSKRSATIWIASPPRKKIPGSATAASVGSRRASSIRSLRSVMRQRATASVTTTASSRRSSARTAHSAKSPARGSVCTTSGSAVTVACAIACASAAAVRRRATSRARCATNGSIRRTCGPSAMTCSIPGNRSPTVNHLRLWSGRGITPFKIDAFNAGNYSAAVAEQIEAKNLSRVLYPDDSTPQGKELRFKQQYFCVSASLQDMLAQHLAERRKLKDLSQAIAIQLNDTHPAMTVVELMRLLVDVYDQAWPIAWKITCEVCSYTNHTLLPEALETWPIAFFERLLPRHLQIVYQINRDFLEIVSARYPNDAGSPPAHVADPRGRRPARAHGLPVSGRLAPRERRREAALAADARDDLRGLRRPVAGALHQRHQRHRRATLAEAGQPGSRRAAHRKARLGVGERSRGPRAPEMGSGRCGVPPALPRGQARQQGAARD